LATTNGGTGLTSFTANGVVYASSSSALATGSGLVFNGTNLGVGVTPSAYNAGKVIEVGTVGNAVFGIGAADMRIISGAYYNSGSGGWIYTASGTAISNYGQTAGSHLWYTAPSGTAGNLVSFTQAMTLDASGNLGVGITSPTARFHIQSATTGSVIVGKWTDGVTDTGYLTTVTGGGAGVGAGGFLTFGAGGGASFTERARIDSSGNFGIGTTSNTAGYKLDVRGNVIAYASSGNVSVVVQTGTDANGAMNAVAGTGLGFNTDATNRNITFSTNSVERFRFGASGQFGIGGANYGLAGQVLTSGGSGAAPTWAAAGGGSQAFVAFGANGGF
jgi:hypothetical protein